MRRSLLALILLATVTAASADNTDSRAADAPDLVHLKPYAANGVSFQLPSNWTVTWSGRLEDTNGQGVDIEADKAAFEVLTLGVTVQVVPTKVAPTLKGTAAYLYNLQVDDKPAQYTKANYEPIMLNGKYPALASRYSHKIFKDDRVYAHRLDLIASKPCGDGWTCIIFSTGLAANENPAKQGMAKIYETVRYQP
ncbi:MULTISPECIES: hypothetical protein [unclassified Burkholderia]|uniref:hypothetical protein n=1 Tax=unclassified Burkholderia TaxID=2613784 RepID=UPI000A80556A|nr:MULTISPECIES: hypothetical protein [unclassified Burkholderia]